MRQRTRTDWTDERVAELRRLWLLDLSAADIGRRLGVSKSAITGKAARLGLACRQSPIIRLTDEEKAERRRQGGYSQPLPLPQRARALAKATDRSKQNGWHEQHEYHAVQQPDLLGFRSCQWIEGEPSADDRCKCGRPVQPDESNWPYCAEHLKRAIGKKASGESA